MYRAVIFVVFIFAALVAGDGDMRKCHRLHPGIMRCCTSFTGNPEYDTGADFKECFDLRKPPPSCDVEECIAKKLGYYGADGKIDKAVLTSVMEKKLENDPEIFNEVKEKCINGDLSQRGPPDMCEFIKMKHCFHKLFVKNCHEWSNEGDCNGIKELAEECTMRD